jgi:hypothetical protein
MEEVYLAVENITPSKIGENGHIEYTWSTNVKERILQFSFQVTRTPNIDITKLQSILYQLILELKTQHDKSTELNDMDSDDDSSYYLNILYKFIGYTRDIIDGKGEYKLTYMMICVWDNFYPILAQYALKCLVQNDNDDHPFGSWKDIKNFCNYCKTQPINSHDHLVNYAINLLNDQIKKDLSNFNQGNSISLAAKWVPREKSAFKWLFNKLAISYFPEYFSSNGSTIKASNKSYMNYRKIISTLNNHLQTVQIYQCNNTWSNIDFTHVTSITLLKQKNAFLNIKNNGEERYNRIDRQVCATNFKTFINQQINSGKELNGKRVEMGYFTSEAIRLINLTNQTPDSVDLQIQINMLNSMWKDNSGLNSSLKNFIPLIDVSESMYGISQNVAIALGIRIAEKSTIGKRIMTFGESPKWINLDECNDLVSMVKAIHESDYGTHANFYAALDLILNTTIESKLPYEDVKDMVLVILSDMQINKFNYINDKSLLLQIHEKYRETGLRVYGKPLHPPHIILWNLKSTDGFPSLCFHENVSMVSGFNPSLLNSFCNFGLYGLNTCTPWSTLMNHLENTRYDYLHQKLVECI